MIQLRGRSIRQKLNFILVATTVSALLLAGLALMLFDLAKQARGIEADILTQADIIGLASSSALAFEDRKVGAENLSVLRASPDVAVAALYDKAGKVFATFSPGEDEAVRAPAAAPAPGVRFDAEWVTVARPVFSNREAIGTVYMQARHDLLGRVLEYTGVLGAIMASSLAAALLLSNRLQRMLTGPIGAVGEVAQKILRTSDFELRAQKTTDDEVGALVDAFNAMLDELGRRAGTLQHANQALRASEQRYQLAVRGSSAGLWDWDVEAGTMFYSPRFKEMLGYSEAGFPNLPGSIAKVIHEDDKAVTRAALRAHLDQGKPYQTECRMRTKAGEWRWFFVAGMAQKDERGKAFRMAGSIIDVTERKQAEQTLQEANRAKDEFIATLAHELRNPLAPIRTGLEILKRDRTNGQASQKAREAMERQLVHMIRLVDDLLDISRITSGKIRLELARISLQSVLDSAVEVSRPAIEAGGHALAIDVPAVPIELTADATRLAQSVGNLLNNAAKYTPAGGRISLRAWRDADVAVIEVADNGVGLPADMLESVFSMFAQVGKTIDRSQGGLGIGLSLVRSLVELHGGTASARSDGPGKGSTFTLRMPCLAEQPPPPLVPAGPAAAAVDAGRLKVLVVDDNVDAAETLAAVLDMLGHSTRLVHSGQEVLAAATAFGPDVVLLDIGLPGMTGYQVARQLREHGRFASTSLIAVTGWGAEADRQRARDAGFDHHLIKPVNLDELQPLLRRQEPGR